MESKGDLDLLVDYNYKKEFVKLIKEIRFKELELHPHFKYLPISTFVGLDKEIWRFIHLHIYFKLITGNHLLKGYHINLEKELLNHIYIDNNSKIRLLDFECKLIILFIKLMLKKDFDSRNYLKI